MLQRAEKDKIIKNLKTDIDNSEAIFLTNLIGISSNEAVEIRKNVREAGGKIIITRNTLFGKAAAGTKAEKMLSNLKGCNAVAFAFSDAAAVAKCLKNAGKELELVDLKAGLLEDKELSQAEVMALADLPSRDEMLGTLLATFMAPISAFARVLNAVKEQKEEGGDTSGSADETSEAAPEEKTEEPKQD